MSYEKSIIGSLMLDPRAIESVKAIVSPDDFANSHLAEVLGAIYALSDNDKPIDVLSLADELKSAKYNSRIGVSDLADMQDEVPSAAHVEHYARGVKDDAKRRAVQRVSDNAINAESGTEAVEEAINALTSLDSGQGDRQVDANQALISVMDKTEAIFNGDIKLQSTGFADLDEQIGGFEGGRLYILGARPAMGKSALALNFALTAIKNNIPTMVFSLEMPSEEVMYRMICAASGLNTRAQRDMQESDWPLLTGGFNVLKDKPLIIDDSGGYTISFLKSQIRAHAAKHEESFYIVDYIQLMKINGFDEVVGFGEISKELKTLAKDIGMPIVILSQLNRGLEQRTDKRPMNSDIRSSGQLEQDADVIIFIYRDEVYFENSEFKGTAELIIRKNRGGEMGTVRVRDELRFARFANIGGGYNDYN
tara:strand:- start:97 stop:1362 length:1266 start_codon:yes stop_codon:yes gene_type:complete